MYVCMYICVYIYASLYSLQILLYIYVCMCINFIWTLPFFFFIYFILHVCTSALVTCIIKASYLLTYLGREKEQLAGNENIWQPTIPIISQYSAEKDLEGTDAAKKFVNMRFDELRFSKRWFGKMKCSKMFDSARCDSTRYNSARSDSTRYDLASIVSK